VSRAVDLLEKICLATSGLNTLLLSFGQLAYVAVHAVEDDRDLDSHFGVLRELESSRMYWSY
jgi:hypothetical protein